MLVWFTYSFLIMVYTVMIKSSVLPPETLEWFLFASYSLQPFFIRSFFLFFFFSYIFITLLSCSSVGQARDRWSPPLRLYSTLCVISLSLKFFFHTICLKNINLGIVRCRLAFFGHRETSLSSQPLWKFHSFCNMRNYTAYGRFNTTHHHL